MIELFFQALGWIVGALFLLWVYEYFFAPIRRVRPYIHAIAGKDADIYPGQLRFILATHQSGWVFKRPRGELFNSEVEAEKARILRVQRDLEINDIFTDLKSKVEARK